MFASIFSALERIHYMDIIIIVIGSLKQLALPEIILTPCVSKSKLLGQVNFAEPLFLFW